MSSVFLRPKNKYRIISKLIFNWKSITCKWFKTSGSIEMYKIQKCPLSILGLIFQKPPWSTVYFVLRSISFILIQRRWYWTHCFLASFHLIKYHKSYSMLSLKSCLIFSNFHSCSISHFYFTSSLSISGCFLIWFFFPLSTDHPRVNLLLHISWCLGKYIHSINSSQWIHALKFG